MTAEVSKAQVRKLWLQAQGLDLRAPFGSGPKATAKAVEHLGYVQIDTISVIERCHHHILYSRIPDYKRSHLHQAQTKDKTVFEYWTHALAYVPTKDYRFYLGDMKRRSKDPHSYYESVTKADLQKVFRLIKKGGPISIRDISDDVLVDKTHAWGSRKPSKKALQLAFNSGDLVISERQGMLKKYELTARHFDWDQKPKAATATEVLDYLIDRSLRSQAVVSLDSICYLDAKRKPAIHKRLEARVRKGEVIPVQVKGVEETKFWMEPSLLETQIHPEHELVHILSPFDPLIIQRKRLQAFFDYEHRFEAYIPKEKRIFGYFSLPVLIDDKIVAVLDLKADRAQTKLLIQQWTWLGQSKSAKNKKKIEQELHRFEEFQFHK
jgi:uncharacterized protein YcaQ